MIIKSVAVLGAGAVGSYVIWGLSEKKDIRLWTTMVDNTPNRGEMTSTASRMAQLMSENQLRFGGGRVMVCMCNSAGLCVPDGATLIRPTIQNVGPVSAAPPGEKRYCTALFTLVIAPSAAVRRSRSSSWA